MKIIVATTNQHKVSEINQMTRDITDFCFESMACLGDIPEIIEDGSTFEENALIKVREVAKYTDLPVMADDSGLVVDALNGEPGIYSARYLGLETAEERNAKILEKLTGISEEERTASFVSVIAYLDEKRREFTFRGTVKGRIHHKALGSRGFGYDPIFYYAPFETTLADVSPDLKNSVSHRSRSLSLFLDHLRNQ